MSPRKLKKLRKVKQSEMKDFKSNWWCSSDEAIEHEKNCKDTTGNCGTCVAILSTSVAMEEYGTEIEIESEDHPLYDVIVNTFGNCEIN